MKRDVYKLLAEKYSLVEQDNLAQYEWSKEELEVSGKMYDVYCNFDKKEEAIDYQFDPRTDRGRDVYAMVPFKVLDIKAYVSDPQGNGPEVIDPNLLKTISSVALETARQEAIQDASDVDVRFGEYM
jgi:hypothetical protein